MKRILVRSLTLVLALGASTIRTRHARAEGWANVRVPVAAHFGEPEHGFESGLHLDFLAVVPLGDETGKERAHLPGRDRPRLAIGPTLSLRTLDLDRLGVGAGLEVVALTPGQIAAGVGVEVGVGKWLSPASGDGLAAHLALSLQLRGASGSDDTVFADTLAVYVAADRSLSTGGWAFTTGLELGSLWLLIWPLIPKWN